MDISRLPEPGKPGYPQGDPAKIQGRSENWEIGKKQLPLPGMKSFFFAGIFLTVFSGCSLFLPEREYEIAFPHLPREYFFIEFWEVDILSLQGGERRLSFPAGQDGFLLSAEKEEALILLATPGGPGSFALKPASLYLNGHSGTRGFLSFADGPAGSVLRRAHREGYDLRRFNVERFFRQFNRNGLASPWFADLACVAESILQGEMALYRIKAAPPVFPGFRSGRG